MMETVYAQNDEAAQERMRKANERARVAKLEQRELRISLGQRLGWAWAMTAVAGEEPRRCWMMEIEGERPKIVTGRGKDDPPMPFSNYPADINACIKDLLPMIRREAERSCPFSRVADGQLVYTVWEKDGSWTAGVTASRLAMGTEVNRPELARAISELCVLVCPDKT